MKTIIWLLILGLAAIAISKTVSGAIRRHDFQERLHDVALEVREKNRDEIRQRVVTEGRKLNLEVSPAEVQVEYTPTSDLNFAQRMVSGIGTFENHRATINVDYTQSILFIAVHRHVKGTALIQSAARAKRAQELPE